MPDLRAYEALNDSYTVIRLRRDYSAIRRKTFGMKVIRFESLLTTIGVNSTMNNTCQTTDKNNHATLYPHFSWKSLFLKYKILNSSGQAITMN